MVLMGEQLYGGLNQCAACEAKRAWRHAQRGITAGGMSAHVAKEKEGMCQAIPMYSAEQTCAVMQPRVSWSTE